MTKKALLMLALSTVAYSSENNYTGCGLNEPEARLNLANNISTKIESTSFLEKSSNSIMGIDLFSKNFIKSSKQSTNLKLKNLKITTKDNQVCASIEKDKLYEISKQLISKVSNYTKSSLPEYEKDKVIKIGSILTDIKNAIVLADLFHDKFPSSTVEELEDKEKLFVNLRDQYNSQYAKLTVVGKYDKLLIDNKLVDQNKEYFLKSGLHKYEVVSSKHCPIQKEFTLDTNQDFEAVVNMNDYNLPYIIINSNKEDANFKLNKESKTLGKKYSIKNCDNSELPYSVTYHDQIENGILELSANSAVEEDFTFYSQSELNKFIKLAKSYDEGTRVEIKYGYLPISLLEGYEDYEDIHTVQLNWINAYKALKYGYGLEYGQADMSKVYEIYYNLGFQLTKISDDTALRIGSVVIVPSLTAQVGFGKHELYNTVNETFKSDKFNDDEEEKFADDYVVLKGTFGIDFVLNENIGLNIYFQKQFTMEQSYMFGTGVSLSF